LLATINSQTHDIKQHEADYNKLVGEMSHQHELVEEKEQTIGALNKAIADHEKSIEVMNRQHQEKEKTIKTLMVNVEEKINTIDELKQQVMRVHELNNEANENVNNKQIKHLNDQLQVITNELEGCNEVIETMKQEHVNEKEALLATINSQTDDIKQHEADYDKLVRETSHDIKQHEADYNKLVGEKSHQHELVEEKEQTIGALNKAIADHEKSIEVMNRQHQEKERNYKIRL
jgi:chromosome segregation ATPase